MHRTDLDKACLQHDIACGEYKDLTRTQPDQLLRDKSFEIASNLKYDRYQRELASMVYNGFLIKSLLKSAKGSGIKNMPNQQLADGFINQLFENSKEQRCILCLKTIIGVFIANGQLISKYDREIRYLLCTIDLYRKYTWVVPLKGKMGITSVNASHKILESSEKESQTKYGLIKAVNFIAVLLKNG